MHLARECIFQVLIAQKILTFATDKYDIRIQPGKLCLKIKKLNFIYIFSFESCLYVGDIFSYLRQAFIEKYFIMCFNYAFWIYRYFTVN